MADTTKDDHLEGVNCYVYTAVAPGEPEATLAERYDDQYKPELPESVWHRYEWKKSKN